MKFIVEHVFLLSNWNFGIQPNEISIILVVYLSNGL